MEVIITKLEAYGLTVVEKQCRGIQHLYFFRIKYPDGKNVSIIELYRGHVLELFFHCSAFGSRV